MKIKSIFLLLFLPFIFGCLTASSFMRTMERNSDITPLQTLDKLGPAKEVKSLPNNIMYMVYPIFLDNTRIIYFKDSKMVLYGYDNDYTHLDAAYQLGLIDREEYHWNYQILQQEDLARRQRALQIFGMYQDMKYQRRSLANQEEAINLQRQPTRHSGTIYDWRTGTTYQYQGTIQK